MGMYEDFLFYKGELDGEVARARAQLEAERARMMNELLDTQSSAQKAIDAERAYLANYGKELFRSILPTALRSDNANASISDPSYFLPGGAPEKPRSNIWPILALGGLAYLIFRRKRK